MSWEAIENHLFDKYCVEGEDKELCKLQSEHDAEIRAKAIEEFYDKVLNFEDYIEPLDTSDFGAVLLYSGKDITNMIVKIAAEMRGAE